MHVNIYFSGNFTGILDSYNSLGVYYEQGFYVKQDVQRGLNYYLAAANKDFSGNFLGNFKNKS
jgi:TPR repeat protein